MKRWYYTISTILLGLALAACNQAVVHVDWVDFVQFGEIQYMATDFGGGNTGRSLTEADLGPEFAKVRFKHAEQHIFGHDCCRDGDAAFLDAGTPVYTVKGYQPEFRLAARRDGRWVLYEADTNPKAKTGADLLDMGGKVKYIGVNSAYDGVTELAAITDPEQVTALVELVLDAPVDQNPQALGDSQERYFIAFHLKDGTVISRAYWPASGELARGILLPDAFRVSVEQALAATMPGPRPTTGPGLTLDSFSEPEAVNPPPPPQTLSGLIYWSDGLWQIDANGQPAPLFDQRWSSLSPDGKQALYVDKDDLWLAGLTTGERRNLTETPDRVECCPRWWPARPDLILFSSWPQGMETGLGSDILTGFLSTVQVGGRDYRILDPDHDTFGRPAPAPDGQTIAYGGGRAGWLYRWNKGPEHFDPASFRLPSHTQLNTLVNPAWSPDGKQLAWVVAGNLEGEWRLGLGVFDLQVNAAQIVHSYEPFGTDGWPPAPAWSPDGQWLAFTTIAQDPAERGVWAARVDGAEAHFLGAGASPVWSPDGQWLAFTRTSPEEKTVETGVWLAEAGVWQPQPAALPHEAEVVDWMASASSESSVGGRLAYVNPPAPSKEWLTVLDLATGSRWDLEGRATPRGWSPTGDYLLVVGEDGHRVYRSDGLAIKSYDVWPVFWTPRDAFPNAPDWLAMSTTDGAVQAISIPAGEVRQVCPPGSPKNNEGGYELWSEDGWLAWAPAGDPATQAGPGKQTLYVLRDGQQATVTTWRLSDDISQTLYQLIDWVPGTRLILAGRGFLSVSGWVDGAPLVTINAETGEITDLDSEMLLPLEAGAPPESYTWHPTQPGLLALVEGNGRFIFENKRLALLDVTTSERRYLTSPDEAVFEPTWSPDGTLLAYAAAPASPGAHGAGEMLEHNLDGRAIFVVNPQTGEIRQLTQSGEAVDGWPKWTTDGAHLIYTRQHNKVTDVRVVSLAGNRDELLVSGLADPFCYYGGCNWWTMLAYAPGPNKK